MGQTPSHQEPSVLNFEELLERCMGNIEFAGRVLSKFEQRFGEDLAELERGIVEEDTAGIARVAHRLKGASANVAAAGLRRQAAEIEELGRSQRVSEIRPHLEQLRDEWAQFADSVSALRSLAGAAG